MKFCRALPLFLVVCNLALAGCSKTDTEHAAEAQTALQQFKTDIDGIVASQPQSKGRMDKEVTKFKALAELSAKIKAVKSGGLPADLKQAHEDFVAKLGKLEPLFAKLGSTVEERISNFSSDPKKSQEFNSNLQTLLPEVQPAGQKLVEVGRKHGIEKLGELVP